MSPQPPGSPNSGKPGSHLRNRTPSVRLADFCSRLDTRQVEGELDAIFRESPEFARNLAHRLSPFLEIYESGTLTLIGAGGEAAVFVDPANQQVIKLCGPPAHCYFGWIPHREPCSGETLELLTWKKDSFLATDVRPKNALVAEATGIIHPIDFIVAGREIAPTFIGKKDSLLVSVIFPGNLRGHGWGSLRQIIFSRPAELRN